MQRYNIGLQIKKFTNLDMQMKLPLMNVIKEELKYSSDGK